MARVSSAPTSQRLSPMSSDIAVRHTLALAIAAPIFASSDAAPHPGFEICST